MALKVTIDEEAQEVISKIIGNPWEQEYLDYGDDDFIASVMRQGTVVQILICKEDGYADMSSFDGLRIAEAITKASEDAHRFTLAQLKWSREQMKKLNCEIVGSQTGWRYNFTIEDKRFTVSFDVYPDSFCCATVLNENGETLFKKTLDGKQQITMSLASNILKTWLIYASSQTK